MPSTQRIAQTEPVRCWLVQANTSANGMKKLRCFPEKRGRRVTGHTLSDVILRVVPRTVPYPRR